MTQQAIFCAASDASIPTMEDLPHILVNKFDEASVDAFYKGFRTLLTKPSVEVIPVIIDSYGGQVYALMAMIDIIKASPVPVATIAMGKAMSCAAVLLSAGHPGLRFAAPNVDVLIHEISAGEFGKTTEINAGVKHLNRLNKKLFTLMEAFTKQPKGFYLKEMKKRTNTDWNLSAAECKKLGIVDHIGIPVLGRR